MRMVSRKGRRAVVGAQEKTLRMAAAMAAEITIGCALFIGVYWLFCITAEGAARMIGG